ncbi:HD-GYP domain-containing protein [Aliikangiella marina]|uniref:HD-GYP domain-containing protein n=1 Tax=Aliikangiella marina TaxID=1712262 RepID=A0A545TH42_9GAMM|nr:HD-GYP domain-containing protein [Aliikangiella marina]TQV76547.1 HD-GYP domain-containing protein [Aliikangiella marina]
MSGQYSYLKKVQIKAHNLRLGMYVAELDKPWDESPFTFQGFPINDTDTLNAIQEECDWVYVDFQSEKAYKTYLQSVEGQAPSQKKTYRRTELEALQEELPRAQKNFNSSSKMVKNIMQKIIAEEEFELEPVQNTVEECVDSILHNPDALMLLSNIKNADEYTAEHCLRVSIMSIAFGKYLGMSKEELQCVGIGAMLHDVGKMKIPEKILNKPGKLSPAEFCVMQDHAVEGYKILKNKKLLSPGVIDIAHSHHEKIDGSGYPRGLLAHQISRYAKIVTVVDTFDAITSERVYSRAETPSQAFKVLTENSGTQFDKTIAKEFIKWMGVYPVGSIVEMQTGEVGVVIRVHQEQKLKPRVLLVTDEEKVKGFQKVVDLARMTVHSSGEAYQIKTVHPNGSFDIDIQQLVQQGLLLRR